MQMRLSGQPGGLVLGCRFGDLGSFFRISPSVSVFHETVKPRCAHGPCDHFSCLATHLVDHVDYNPSLGF